MRESLCDLSRIRSLTSHQSIFGLLRIKITPRSRSNVLQSVNFVALGTVQPLLQEFSSTPDGPLTKFTNALANQRAAHKTRNDRFRTPRFLAREARVRATSLPTSSPTTKRWIPNLLQHPGY